MTAKQQRRNLIKMLERGKIINLVLMFITMLFTVFFAPHPLCMLVTGVLIGTFFTMFGVRCVLGWTEPEE